MTPTQYAKSCKPYIAAGRSNGKVMSAKLFIKLDKAWNSFTDKQKDTARKVMAR